MSLQPTPGVVYTRRGALPWKAPGRPDLFGGATVTDPPPVVVDPASIYAGAPTLGTVAYDLPTVNVRYVSPDGNDSNPGTLASPMRSAFVAAQQIKASGTADNPATVVMRGGEYHEGGYQPGNGAYLRFQAYPGETAWFDGSSVLTGSWTNNGNGTYTTAYAAPAVPALGNDNIQDDPNALLPDMCFLDRLELYQTADGSTPSAGQFSVNRAGNTITIATNPAGREVRVSDTVYLVTTGSRLDLLGVGIRRYRCASNTLHAGLYYGGTSAGTVIENCRFEQMGRNCLSINKANFRVTANTFKRVGQTAVLCTTCDYLTIENNQITESNTGKWQAQPTSGAIKITVARGTTVRYNHLTFAHKGIQVWWDVSATQVKCYGNFIDGTSVDGTTYADTGINYEESDGGVWGGVQYESIIAGNTILNCRKSMAVVAAGHVLIAHNTISSKWPSGAQAIWVNQDRDTNHGIQVPIANCHWWAAGVRILNNRILAQSNGWQFLAYDSQGEVPRERAISYGLGSSTGQQKGGLMLDKVEANWFSPATGSTSAGSVMATVGNYSGARTNFNTPAALRVNNTDLGLDTTRIGINYQSAADPSGTDHDTALPMEPAVAALLGLTAGSRYVGNPLPAPVLN